MGILRKMNFSNDRKCIARMTTVSPNQATPDVQSINDSDRKEAYSKAGVDLTRADAAVEIAKRAAKSTETREVKTSIGGFSGLFEIPAGYQQPVILTGCDGVGTKLKLAFDTGIHNTVGVDLVAMCVNDVLVNGGKPLVFLDYWAGGEIDPVVLDGVLAGIAEGCRQAGCALVGGETAEMPGLYQKTDYDLAGFTVGVAEKSQLYPRLDEIAEGDVLIGLSSSGFHSNGFSLVRKILTDNQKELSETITLDGKETTLGDALLVPTRIYVKPVLRLLEQFKTGVKAMSHITGGGFYDNLPRVLPDNYAVEIDTGAWKAPEIFNLIQDWGNLTSEAMWQTFNCGIGFILIVSENQADEMRACLNDKEESLNASVIGKIKRRDTDAPQVVMH